MEASVASATREETIAAIMSATAEDDPLLRAYRLRQLLSRASSEELRELFDQAVKLDDHQRQSAVIAPLLARWAVLDEASATAAVQPFLKRLRQPHSSWWPSVESAVAEAWAKAMPEAGLREAMSQPSVSWARSAAGWSLEGLTHGDAGEQLSVLARLPASRLRDDLCVDALVSLLRTDCAAAEAQLSLVSDAKRRFDLETMVLGQLANENSDAAVKRLTERSADLTADAAGALECRVLSAVARHDAAAALSALNELPEDHRANALGAVLVGWAGEHPLDALEWAAANGISMSEPNAYASGTSLTSASLISAALGADRAKTLEWIRSQPASTDRELMLRQALTGGSLAETLQIYGELSPEMPTVMRSDVAWDVLEKFGSDVEGATDWVKQLPEGSRRGTAIRDLSFREAVNSPDRQDAILKSWPVGLDRDAALRGVTAFLSQSEPGRALEFAQQINEPTARWKAYVNLAPMWLTQDEPAARRWIDSTSEFSADEKRALIRRLEGR